MGGWRDGDHQVRVLSVGSHETIHTNRAQIFISKPNPSPRALVHSLVAAVVDVGDEGADAEVLAARLDEGGEAPAVVPVLLAACSCVRGCMGGYMDVYKGVSFFLRGLFWSLTDE